MTDFDLIRLPPTQPIRLDNRTCVYCNVELVAENDTIDHAIARRFIPKGKLDGQWNLIVHACVECNRRKAALEDDISAITMQPTVTGQYAAEDDVLIREAARKGAGSKSRLTGNAVSDSYEKRKFEVPIGPGAKFTFNMTGLPAIAPDRLFDLAGMQLQAFFYWITYDKEARIGHFWPGGFFTVMGSVRSDWGNVAQLAFMKAVQGWTHRVHAIGAGEYFKVSIRRHPAAECWSWALEWNQNYRLIGFLGDRQTAEEVVKTFPDQNWKPLPDGRYREEHRLRTEDDCLFAPPDPGSPREESALQVE